MIKYIEAVHLIRFPRSAQPPVAASSTTKDGATTRRRRSFWTSLAPPFPWRLRQPRWRRRCHHEKLLPPRRKLSGLRSYTAPSCPPVPPLLKVRSKVYTAAVVVGRVGQPPVLPEANIAGRRRHQEHQSYKWQSTLGGLSDRRGAGSNNEVGDSGEWPNAFLTIH